MSTEIYIGLMSGTSLDAVDAALVAFHPDSSINVLATYSLAIPAELREKILLLCHPNNDQIQLLGTTDIELGVIFADCCLKLLAKSNIPKDKVVAIGSHGQTIRHVPDGPIPFTLQIGDPNIITTLTHITTVADFRRRDMALGGQAAPLAPAFHRYLFQSKTHNRFVINLGGIANITFLPHNTRHNVIGFDSGPGNMLLDIWCQQHLKQSYDNNGDWAAGGTVINELLRTLMSDPYFSKPIPKSTGREYFNLPWLIHYIKSCSQQYTAQDIQATLVELTVCHLTQSILQIDTQPAQIYFCGGGAYNQYLLTRVQHHLPNYSIATTADLGLDPKWVEAVTFAWLAKQTMHGQPGNLPCVTGATSASVLGAIYSKMVTAQPPDRIRNNGQS